MILRLAGDKKVSIGVNKDLVRTVVVGQDGLDEFAQGINGAGSPGGLPSFCEVDAVTLPFGERGEVGLEVWMTLQRNVEVMTQLKGCKKHPVVLQLSGNVIN